MQDIVGSDSEISLVEEKVETNESHQSSQSSNQTLKIYEQEFKVENVDSFNQTMLKQNRSFLSEAELGEISKSQGRHPPLSEQVDGSKESLHNISSEIKNQIIMNLSKTKSQSEVNLSEVLFDYDEERVEEDLLNNLERLHQKLEYGTENTRKKHKKKLTDELQR